MHGNVLHGNVSIHGSCHSRGNLHLSKRNVNRTYDYQQRNKETFFVHFSVKL